MSLVTAPSPPPADVVARPEPRIAALVAVLALIASLIVAPPWRSSTLPTGQAARLVEGAAERSDGERWRAIERGSFIPVGARVRTPDEEALLAIEGGTLRLARGTEAVLDAAGYDLAAGRVLTEADVVVVGRLRGVEATGRGVWRLDAGIAPRVGVYSGGVGVERQDVGTEVAVSPLTQVDLVQDAPAEDTVPLRYLATDPWDARLLAEALAIDRTATQLREGLARTYGIAGRPTSFYDDFSAADDATLRRLAELAPRVDGDGFGPPPDLLLGLVVVDLLDRGARLGREPAIEEVVTLRRQGASWGIVLRRHDLTAQDLRDAFEIALTRRAGEVAASPQPTTGPTPTPTGSPGPSPSPSPSPSPTPTPTPSPTPSPSPTDDPGVLDPLDGVIEPLPEPIREPIEDLGDLIDDAVGGLPLPVRR